MPFGFLDAIPLVKGVLEQLRRWVLHPYGTKAVFPVALPNMPVYFDQDGLPMTAFPEVVVTLDEMQRRFGYR